MGCIPDPDIAWAKLLASTAKAWAAHPLAMPARMRNRRVCDCLKMDSCNILQLYSIHQMQSQIETRKTIM